MRQVVLDIPDTLVELPVREQNVFVRAGLYEAQRAWVRQLETEIAESEGQVRRLAARYGVSFARFEAALLPTLDTLQAHEDYNDWFYWEQVLAEKRSLLAQLQAVRVN